MSDQRLSDKPYYANITFRNGETRTIDYELMVSSSGSVTFATSKDGTGPLLIVILDAVQTIECFDCAIPKGSC